MMIMMMIMITMIITMKITNDNFNVDFNDDYDGYDDADADDIILLMTVAIIMMIKQLMMCISITYA